MKTVDHQISSKEAMQDWQLRIKLFKILKMKLEITLEEIHRDNDYRQFIITYY